MQRVIEASAKDWLTLAEMAQALNVSESTVKELVRSKRLPPPVHLSRRAARWHWLDPIAFAHLASRMQPPEEKES